MINIRNTHPSEMGEVYRLRWDVLRHQGQPMDGTERDEHDDMSAHPETVHGVATDKGAVIATGRIHRIAGDPYTWQIRYMATLPEYRRKGIGTMVLSSMERELLRGEYPERPTLLIANARIEAIEMYRRAGYISVGEQFDLVGIPHIKIAKRVNGGIW